MAVKLNRNRHVPEHPLCRIASHNALSMYYAPADRQSNLLTNFAECETPISNLLDSSHRYIFYNTVVLWLFSLRFCPLWQFFLGIMDSSQLPPFADLSQLPAGRPPANTLPNFIDPVTLKAPIVALNVLFLALATLLVVLRLYTRKYVSRVLGWEDCTVHSNQFRMGNAHY